MYLLDHSITDLKALFDRSPDVIFGVDDEGRVIFANPKAVDMFGYADSEFSGFEFARLIPGPSQMSIIEEIELILREASARSEGLKREIIAVSKDGREIHVEMMLTPVDISSFKALVAMSDIR